VSRKKYGYEGESARIEAANPGIVESLIEEFDPVAPGKLLIQPLNPGTILTVPQIFDGISNTSSQTFSENINEVAIIINGERFRYWVNVKINDSIDAITTVDFTAPFESDAPGFQDAFKPFSFAPVEVTIGGVRKFTGRMVAVNPQVLANPRTVSISCYSLPGTINDCNPSPSTYPIEYKNLRLGDIASRLLKPFGFKAKFLADQGAPFEKVSCDVSTKVWAFLTTLAAQRNLILTDDINGNLIFLESIEAGNPVAVLAQGSSPVVSVVPLFEPQRYYSHITGIETPSPGLKGSQFTVKNPFLTGIFRPYVFTVQDTKGGDVKTVVQVKVARMFANMVSYSLTVDTWRDPAGNLWVPNTTLKLTAPDAMIYQKYEFLIRSVEREKLSNKETAVLTLVLPGVFRGEIPDSLPWE
jgi:prophage tail gpP-like protein